MAVIAVYHNDYEMLKLIASSVDELYGFEEISGLITSDEQMLNIVKSILENTTVTEEDYENYVHLARENDYTQTLEYLRRK